MLGKSEMFLFRSERVSMDFDILSIRTSASSIFVDNIMTLFIDDGEGGWRIGIQGGAQ
jgi:hypothetical protein